MTAALAGRQQILLQHSSKGNRIISCLASPCRASTLEINGWIPLGLRFDQNGNLLVTNLVGGKHSVLIFPAAALNGPWLEF